MKKFIFIGFFALFLAGCASRTFAQSAASPPSSGQAGSTVTNSAIAQPFPPQTQPNIFGQDQRYTVTFRGNGEAVVSVRVVFSNQGETPISALNFRVPKVEPQDVIAYQVLADPYCIQYLPLTVDDRQKGIYQPRCGTYQEPDYFNYYGGSTKYQKAITDVKTDTITVTLPRTVLPNKSGSLILYYRAPGYARKSLFGSYNFVFETLKVEDKIQNLQVGISTDSDLFLKGAKGTVNYRFDDAAMEMKTAGALAAPAASPRFDQYYQQIGQGSIVKTATNLQPLDSYTVKGTYADSRIKLYAGWIIGGGVLVFLFIIFISAVVRWALRKITRPQTKNTQATITAPIASLLESLGLSFVSTIVILFYTVALYFFSRIFGSAFPYEFTMVIQLLTLIISFAVYGILLFAPGIFVGIRRGFGWGLGTIGLTILWLSILVVFLLVMIMGFGFSRPQPYLMMSDPVMNTSGMTGSSTAPSTAK